MIGSKRGPAAVLANPKVQEAAVEKGIEVAGKLVDKQLQIIDDAQQKAADFLKKEVSKDELRLTTQYHLNLRRNSDQFNITLIICR